MKYMMCFYNHLSSIMLIYGEIKSNLHNVPMEIYIYIFQLQL